jgi:transcriptional regulator with XRE-family HTH domain
MLKEIVDDLKDGCAVFEYSVPELAALAGVSPTTVYRLFEGTTKYPRFETLVKIADVLNYAIYFQKKTVPLSRAKKTAKIG